MSLWSWLIGLNGGTRDAPPKTTQADADWRDIMRDWDLYESEGAAAGLKGKTRDDCPYDKQTQKEQWNFWVYGCENAAGELKTLAEGFVVFSTTADTPYQWRVPLQEAIDRGMWKPRWANLLDQCPTPDKVEHRSPRFIKNRGIWNDEA